jgi:glycosyltransferase involved in cell wall biosynthesis
MKVSVVIPAYNEEKILYLCLVSLKKQTVDPFEIIVVDNNSRDATMEVAKKYGAKVIRERRQGISYARSAGFDAAEGEIIARCDADSILPFDWIQRIGENFEKRDIIAVTGPCFFYNLGRTRAVQRIPKLMHTAIYFKSSKAALKCETLFGSNMALTKEGWRKVRREVCLDDKNMHEDMDLAAHLAKYGKIYYDPKLVADISSRRVRSLKAYYDYPKRWYKSIKHAKKLMRPVAGKKSAVK